MRTNNLNYSDRLQYLVEDIYNVIDREEEIEPELLEDFSGRIQDAILQWSQPKKQSKGLRMSNIGRPARQLWYDSKNGSAPKPNASTRIKFLYGHLLEEVLLLFVRMAKHEVTDEQKEVDVDGIKGHIDCKIDGEVVDIKTASNFAFKKFADGTLPQNDTFGYMAQLSGYEAAEGTSDGGFLAINKESGELALFRPGQLSKPNPHAKIKQLKEALDLDSPPDKCYTPIPEGKKGNEILPPTCVYCHYKNECWSDSNDGDGLRIFKYSNGLKYFTKVNSEPRVEEVV